MEKMMSSYEALFIVSVANGEIVETAEWGRRRLAYPIEDMNEGYYVIVTFKSAGEFPNELRRIANIDETVIRSLVIRLEYDAAVRAAEKKAEAAARAAAEAAAKAAAEAAAAEAVVAETADAEPADAPADAE